MIRFAKYTALLLLMNGCNKPVEKPVWLNQQSMIAYPDVQLQFKSTATNWSASLMSFIQPIPLLIKYNNGGFTVLNENKNGIIEGPAQLCLSSGNIFFYYPVYLHNKEWGAVSHKDYRSPKTVNPDSSLHQQRIVHEINQYRNLVYTEKKLLYFFEEDIILAPKAGHYRAISNEPLSAFYIQPGSCVNIPIQSIYNQQKDLYEVTAGPLQDKFDNVVADGTTVAFIYTDNTGTNRMEASLLHGYATVFIPAKAQSIFSLNAIVNETKSTTIQLTH